MSAILCSAFLFLSSSLDFVDVLDLRRFCLQAAGYTVSNDFRFLPPRHSPPSSSSSRRLFLFTYFGCGVCMPTHISCIYRLLGEEVFGALIMCWWLTRCSMILYEFFNEIIFRYTEEQECYVHFFKFI